MVVYFDCTSHHCLVYFKVIKRGTFYVMYILPQ